jgi:Tfp pilus assembly protein PilO
MSARKVRPAFDLRRDLWRILAVLGGLLLVNLLFYLFLNLPRQRALGGLERERDEIRRALKVSTQRAEAMAGLIATYDRDIVKLDDFFKNRLGTQAERMTTVQKEIRSIATEFRIDPESIDYNPTEVEGTDLTAFQITVPLVGGYPNLRHFVNRIETSEHMFIVDSIELAGSRDGGAMLSLTIKMSTYFRSPDREFGRVRPKGPGST